MSGRLAVFMPYGEGGASARVRVYGWLRQLGLDAEVHPYLGEHTAGARALLRRPIAAIHAEASLRKASRSPRPRVLLHREASPLSGGQVELQILGGADFSVYDLDDAMQWDWGAEGGIRRVRPKAAKTIACVRRADRVIVGNEVLADWASSWAREVVVIPSCLDPAMYAPKRTYALSDPPRLGWIGSPATERYLRWIGPALLDVHRRTGARLEVVSTGRRSLGMVDGITERLEWTERRGVEALGRWDVGLMPLSDRLLDRGKSGYKLLQYGAAAIPAVGSPVGVSRQILGSTGQPSPASREDWVDALVGLLEAPENERRRLGQRARRLVVERFSYEVWADRWLAAVSTPG